MKYILSMALGFFLFLSLLAGAKSKSYTLSYGFIENKGQIYDQENHPNLSVLYLFNRPGMNMQLKRNGFSYDTYVIEKKERKEKVNNIRNDKFPEPEYDIAYKFHRVDVELANCNTNVRIQAEEPFGAYFNYYGTAVATDIHQYKKITYKNIYPNIDLVFNLNKEKAEYDFVIHPGGKVDDIQMEYKGMENLKQTEATELSIAVAHGKFTDNIPKSYELENWKKVEVAYALTTNNKVGFITQAYNNNNTLVIDPTPNLLWGTYCGGDQYDLGLGIATDNNNNAVVIGWTASSTAIATAGAYQGTFAGNYDALILKFAPDGTIVWGTYYGGTGVEEGEAIATDPSGNIFATGYAGSTTGIATPGVFQTSLANAGDCFVSKFDPLGNLVWGTYYGGIGNDVPRAITVDKLGNVIVSGGVTGGGGSPDRIVTPGAYQTIFGGAETPFLAKFSSDGKTLQWGTYYGRGASATGNEGGYGVVTDQNNNIFLTGYVDHPTGIATPGAYQSALVAGDDAFVAHFSSGGSLLWGTYYAGGTGSGNNSGYGIAIDANGNVLVTGETPTTTGVATAGTYQTAYGGGFTSAFISQFDSSNGSLKWATYLGGNSFDYGKSIALNGSGNIIVAGYSCCDNAIATYNAYQTLNAFADIFIANLNSNGTLLNWGTYYGGSNTEFLGGMALDAAGGILVTGQTSSSSSIATPGAYQTLFGGGVYDVFVAKFSAFSLNYTVTPVICNGGNNGIIAVSLSGGTAPFTYLWNTGQTTQTVNGLSAGTYTVTVTDAASAVIIYGVAVTQPLVLTTNMTTTPDICSQDNGTGKANVSGGTSPYTYNWNNGQTTQTAKNLSAGNYTVTITDNNNCPSITGTITISSSTALVVTTSKNLSICPGINSTISATGGTSYIWSTGATGNTITISPYTTTMYTVSVTGGSCTKDTSIKITTNPLPIITIGGNTSICSGSSATLTATGGNKYLWNTGAIINNITVSPTTATTYTVIVTNSFGCTDSSNVTVTVLPVVAISNSQTICSGDSTQLSASGGNSYLWNTGATTNSIKISPTSSTNYIVTVNNGLCSNSAGAKVTVNPKPIATTCCNATITSGENVTLTLTTANGNTINWTPTTILSCNTCTNPTANPTVNTTYYLTITDNNGCQKTDSITITVKQKCGDIYVPNAFSPNGDNQNDILYIKAENGCISSITFEIYDRWGVMVFSSADPNTGWDGKYKNQICNTDVFVYNLNATLSDGSSINKKGNISLLK